MDDPITADRFLVQAEALLMDSQEATASSPSEAKLLALLSIAASQLAIALLIQGQSKQDVRDTLQREFASALREAADE